jgi:hypothetical protein
MEEKKERLADKVLRILMEDEPLGDKPKEEAKTEPERNKSEANNTEDKKERFADRILDILLAPEGKEKKAAGTALEKPRLANMPARPDLSASRRSNTVEIVYDVVSLTHKGSCGNLFMTQSIMAPLGNTRKLLAVSEVVYGKAKSILLYALDEKESVAALEHLEDMRQLARAQVRRMTEQVKVEEVQGSSGGNKQSRG